MSFLESLGLGFIIVDEGAKIHKVGRKERIKRRKAETRRLVDRSSRKRIERILIGWQNGVKNPGKKLRSKAR